VPRARNFTSLGHSRICVNLSGEIVLNAKKQPRLSTWKCHFRVSKTFAGTQIAAGRTLIWFHRKFICKVLLRFREIELVNHKKSGFAGLLHLAN
jgi:hypothetical protein